jgi:hypothetical protein
MIEKIVDSTQEIDNGKRLLPDFQKAETIIPV